MNDLEKFLNECEKLYKDYNWGDPYAQKLLAMVRYLYDRRITADYIDEQLNKIARGESNE